MSDQYYQHLSAAAQSAIEGARMKTIQMDGQTYDIDLNQDRIAILSQLYPDLTLGTLEVLDAQAVCLRWESQDNAVLGQPTQPLVE